MTKKQLRKKLALMLANLKKKRPYYCEVEYLESTGTQYIDTGFKIDDTCGYDVGWMALNADDRIIFGTKGAGDSRWVLSGNNNPNVNLSWNTGYGKSGLGLNKIQTAQMNYLNDRKRVLNNTPISNISETLSSSASTYNVCIFGGYWGSSTVSLYSTCRIYYAKITKGTTLVRDFIPVLDWDYVPCLYDKVSGQLFYNAGTGDFLYGREIHYVDYLEGTGTQYIDTGLNYFADYEIGIKLRNNVANKALGNTAINCMERNNATDHNWRFSSNGSWDSNIDILEYHVMKWKEDKIYADGVELTAKTKAKGSANMLLFGVASTLCYPNIIYFCKLWNPDNGELVRDYIPAIDENGVGFMFDRVTHTIFDNAGTGNFQYPPIELEYIESTGTQYVDTGVVGDYQKGVELEVYITGNLNNGCGVGSWGDNTGTERDWLFYVFGNDFRIGFGSANNSNGRAASLNTWYKWKAITVDGRQQQYINDEFVFTSSSQQNFTTNYNLYLFGMNNRGTFGYELRSRMKYVKLYDGDTLVRDFIPVYYNGSAGMWDKVNSLFYPNLGTGSFVTSKIIEPKYE